MSAPIHDADITPRKRIRVGKFGKVTPGIRRECDRILALDPIAQRTELERILVINHGMLADVMAWAATTRP